MKVKELLRPPPETVRRIRELNDAFRTTFHGGRVMMTSGIAALSDPQKAKIFAAIKAFTAFDKANDPHAEHDFVSVEIDDFTVFAKIDLYEKPGVKGTDGEPVVARVLTIMLAEEY